MRMIKRIKVEVGEKEIKENETGRKPTTGEDGGGELKRREEGLMHVLFTHR